MIHLLEICGITGWGLALVTLICLVLIGRAVHQLARGRSRPSPALEYGLHAILFWGGMAAVLGFLGQCSGIYRALTVIIPAPEISPKVVAQGFAESFVPSFWGFGVLVACAVAWTGLRIWYRQRIHHRCDRGGFRPGAADGRPG